jgi:UDP-glucose 4-epimerase
MKSKKVVVTGGCGFIGSTLSTELAKENQVTIIDNFHSGKIENALELLKNKNVKLVKGNIKNYEMLVRIFNDKDVVFHLGAIPSIVENWERYVEANNVNITGTMNVLQAAVKNDIQRVVFASSSSVYGVPEKVPTPEDSTLNPTSPYGAAKLVGEHYCRIFMEAYGLPTVYLRYFNIYGPRQDPNSPYAAVVPKFISSGLKGKPFEIHGDGKQTRDMIYINDVVNATIAAGEGKKCVGEAINIGCGKEISINDLGRKIAKIIGVGFKARHSAARKGDIKRSCADVSKMRRLLKFRPEYSLDAGLSETIKYLENSKKRR